MNERDVPTITSKEIPDIGRNRELTITIVTAITTGTDHTFPWQQRHCENGC